VVRKQKSIISTGDLVALVETRAAAPVGANSALISLPAGAERMLILNITEPGRNLHAHFGGTHHELRYFLILDGVYWRMKNLAYLTPYLLNGTNVGGGYGVNLAVYTSGGNCEIIITCPFEWQKELRLEVTNPAGESHNVSCSVNYLKLT